MTDEIVADGWTADWLVGWLASIGVTWRDRAIKLSWTDEPVPRAVFHVNSVEQLEATMPTAEEAAALAITRELDGRAELPRKPTHAAYADRAHLARTTTDLSVGATLSDLGIGEGDDLPHSPFDAAVPKGLTVAQRLATACNAADGKLAPSLEGGGRTAKLNGLGFDLRRLASSAVPGKATVDAHAETLAFFGCLFFTQCGQETRGWASGSMFATGAFRWATWSEPLDWAGIDAFLDHFYSRTRDCHALGPRTFESIAYRPMGSADSTRGYDGLAAGSDS